MFHGGTEAFFSAWAEFTETDSPRLVQRPPQLVLVARDFDGRTDAALSYLTENDMPITVLRVTVYEDQDGRRFVDVGADHELELPSKSEGPGTPASPRRFEIDGRRIAVSDLLDAGLVEAETPLIWTRPRVGATYQARVLPSGQIALEDSRAFASPSRAAVEAAGIPAYDGWHAWVIPDGRSLSDLRTELLDGLGRSDETDAP